MNKVWLVLVDDRNRWEQTCIFSTREKANKFVQAMANSEQLDEFDKVSRETDPFDIYEYEGGYGVGICSIIIEEFEVR